MYIKDKIIKIIPIIKDAIEGNNLFLILNKGLSVGSFSLKIFLNLFNSSEFSNPI